MRIIYTPEDQAVIDQINQAIQDRSEEICRCSLQSIEYGTLSHRGIYKALQEDLQLKLHREQLADFIATRTKITWEINYK